MFKVYWTESCETDSLAPAIVTEIRSADFGAVQMGDALKLMEQLRANPHVSFVTMVSENPNSVGKPGVSEVGSDYNWTKRRYNERAKD